MASNNRIAFALAQLEGRLHRGARGHRCACGQCTHWIVQAARSAGVQREQLEAELGPVNTPDQRPRRRRPAGQTARICENASVRPRGHRGKSPGMVAFLDRFHQR